MLKNSVRNSRYLDSENANFLFAEASKLMMPGPMIVFRAALPKTNCGLPGAKSTKAAVLKNRSRFFSLRFRFGLIPVAFG